MGTKLQIFRGNIAESIGQLHKQPSDALVRILTNQLTINT